MYIRSIAILKKMVKENFQANLDVSFGPNECQDWTAFTENRDLHAVCSPGLIIVRPSDKMK